MFKIPEDSTSSRPPGWMTPDSTNHRKYLPFQSLKNHAASESTPKPDSQNRPLYQAQVVVAKCRGRLWASERCRIAEVDDCDGTLGAERTCPKVLSGMEAVRRVGAVSMFPFYYRAIYMRNLYTSFWCSQDSWVYTALKNANALGFELQDAHKLPNPPPPKSTHTSIILNPETICVEPLS